MKLIRMRSRQSHEICKIFDVNVIIKSCADCKPKSERAKMESNKRKNEKREKIFSCSLDTNVKIPITRHKTESEQEKRHICHLAFDDARIARKLNGKHKIWRKKKKQKRC